MRLCARASQRVGADAIWDKSENALEQCLNDKNLDWQLQPGEGAFYGPKIEFSLRDCLNRVWQLGTIQLDFSMPERLGAEYVDEDSERRVPVMLHRAILGSVERFIGILIEHHAGSLPLWLAPVQAVVLTITEKQDEFARQVQKNLAEKGFNVELDLRNEKIGYKIREHTLSRIPYLLVIGDREVESQTVAVRTREGEDQGSMALAALCEKLGNEVARHG